MTMECHISTTMTACVTVEDSHRDTWRLQHAGVEMNTDWLDLPAQEAPLDQLERSLIDEYVRGRGYDPHNLANLSEQEQHELLADASVYASSKLTEVESRSRFFHGIHAGAQDYRRRGPGHS